MKRRDFLKSVSGLAVGAVHTQEHLRVVLRVDGFHFKPGAQAHGAATVGCGAETLHQAGNGAGRVGGNANDGASGAGATASAAELGQ